MPLVLLEAESFVVVIEDILAALRAVLSRPVASLAAYREDIMAATGWLFTGF